MLPSVFAGGSFKVEKAGEESVMEYRILGKTGLKISRMGFGGIPIQRIDAEGTKVLIHRLMEEGVNYIDTARGIYGQRGISGICPGGSGQVCACYQEYGAHKRGYGCGYRDQSQESAHRSY